MSPRRTKKGQASLPPAPPNPYGAHPGRGWLPPPSPPPPPRPPRRHWDLGKTALLVFGVVLFLALVVER